MTTTPAETVLVAAAIAVAFMAVVVIAYVALTRRGDAESNRLQAQFEADFAPHSAEIVRIHRAKLAERNAATQDQPMTENTP
jgi:Skp family chaperone for outer membrane proteins